MIFIKFIRVITVNQRKVIYCAYHQIHVSVMIKVGISSSVR